MDMPVERQMPLYQSHKRVWALEIASVSDPQPGAATGCIIHFVDTRFADREVDPKLFARYRPVEGDFFVVYDDGYESISPRKAFLDGYTRLGPAHQGERHV